MKEILHRKIVCKTAHYNATAHIIFRNYHNEKGFNGMVNFHALGIKKHLLALALCTGVAIGTIAEVHATSPNHNPPSLKSNAPNVYVVKRGITLWDISRTFSK